MECEHLCVPARLSVHARAHVRALCCGMVSCLAPSICLESGPKPRKIRGWPLLPPGEVKARGFTIKVWKIFQLTSSPQFRPRLRWGVRVTVFFWWQGQGVPGSGSKIGFPLKGLTTFSKTRQTLGVEQTPVYDALKFHPPKTWWERWVNLQRKWLLALAWALPGSKDPLLHLVSHFEISHRG